MKVIIAIIKPDRLEAVKEELYKAEVNLITVSEVLVSANIPIFITPYSLFKVTARYRRTIYSQRLKPMFHSLNLQTVFY